MSRPPTPRGPRPRDHGLVIGSLPPGRLNSVTDVPGVSVGHVTVWRDEPSVARTGITVVLPAPPDQLFDEPLAAGVAVLNGAGELTGAHQVREWGLLETPIYLTSTHAVGRVYDGAVAVAIAVNPAIGVDSVAIPVVGECDDSGLSDARSVHVSADDVRSALASADRGPVEEGAVGAGVGMECFEWKGGIGTASRRVTDDRTVGVLVLANFGRRQQLRIDGVPIGRLLGGGEPGLRSAGSCIAVVATDAPLSSLQAGRLANRPGLGLARAGSTADHGSGEISVAFSTARGTTSDSMLDEIFEAAVDATEEAVLNALWAAPTVTGRDGRTVEGLPHEACLELLRAYGRLEQRVT